MCSRLSSLQAMTESYLTLHLRSCVYVCARVCVCVCVCEVAHSRMNITSIDQTNVGRKGCRPQQLINIPLITWGTECVCYWKSECRWSPPNSQRCIYKCCPTEELLTCSYTQIIAHTHLTTSFTRFTKIFTDAVRTKGIGKYLHVCISVWFFFWVWRVSFCESRLSVCFCCPLFPINPVFPQANGVTDRWSQMPTESPVPCVSDSLPQRPFPLPCPSCVVPLDRLFMPFFIIWYISYAFCGIVCGLHAVWNKLTDCVVFSLSISVTPLFISLSATGFSSLPRLWPARSCVICLIFGCSCVLSCQLNIRHIPTESGTDFWSVLYLWKKDRWSQTFR